ncbi:class I SAM-dependent methyltransferase [Qipengyuania sp.]|uniref:class I SAM-dependent methyltransferase n=1 Tax=Qipengyuania sp. TaxID=2004515 RepID=UPI003AF8BE10
MNEYTTGEYFNDQGRHTEDSEYKIKAVSPLLKGRSIRTVADVGCGSGAIAELLSRDFEVTGYDLGPHVESIPFKGAKFVRGDFTEVGTDVDLITMFDVFEHVPDPEGFIASCSHKARYMLFHIPLDDTWLNSFRDSYRAKLSHPGHLIFLTPTAALNIVARAGLRTIDYCYSPAFRYPSGRRSLAAKVAGVPREIMYSVSPWLAARTLGNVSLAVLAETPRR